MLRTTRNGGYPHRVLACAPSNSAADLIASRVLKSRPASEMLRLVAFGRAK